MHLYGAVQRTFSLSQSNNDLIKSGRKIDKTSGKVLSFSQRVYSKCVSYDRLIVGRGSLTFYSDNQNLKAVIVEKHDKTFENALHF